MLSNETITLIIILLMFVYFIILLIINLIQYSLFCDEAKKIKASTNISFHGTDEDSGFFVGNTYYFRMPIPIAIKTKNEKLQKLIDAHDRTAKLFWVSAIIIIPTVIIVLNLINE